MPIRKLREYLDSNNIKYVLISHSPAYTAQEVAERAHVSGREVAKTVIVKLNGELAMAVLPASKKVDFDLLREGTGAEFVELADEDEFAGVFPDCELGAEPPFGNLYNMNVYVAAALAEDEEIAFSAGTHSELIRMSYADYEKLVKPKVIRFSFNRA